MLRDEVTDERCGTRIHEAGHASAAWHFSGRKISKPPFTEIVVRCDANPAGQFYGYVDVPLKSLGFDVVTEAAIRLAGIYARECAGDESESEWIELLENRPGTDGTDDYVDVLDLAKREKKDPHELMSAALQALRGIADMPQLTRAIASLLEETERVSITDKSLADLLAAHSAR